LGIFTTLRLLFWLGPRGTFRCSLGLSPAFSWSCHFWSWS